MNIPPRFHQPRISQSDTAAGFSLIEVMVASVVLVVGIVGVVQLVAMAMAQNSNNRYDTTAQMIAQRQLEQMAAQDLAVMATPGLTDYNFLDADGFNVLVGGVPVPAAIPPAQPPPGNVERGCALNATGAIDFTIPCGAVGYTKTITPGGYSHEVRWNVITVYANVAGAVVPAMKRITVAARGGAARFPSASLAVLVGKK